VTQEINMRGDPAGEVTQPLQSPPKQGPADETPTVAILERWRAMKNQPAAAAPDKAARSGTVNWSQDRVREIVDGNDPIPPGLDQESVAAARRIARYLARRWNR
jgi:hypothetical protein